ncbi:MAG: hypothetical protein AAF629_19665 [Chloroflexota bacterium]
MTDIEINSDGSWECTCGNNQAFFSRCSYNGEKYDGSDEVYQVCQVCGLILKKGYKNLSVVGVKGYGYLEKRTYGDPRVPTEREWRQLIQLVAEEIAKDRQAITKYEKQAATLLLESAYVNVFADYDTGHPYGVEPGSDRLAVILWDVDNKDQYINLITWWEAEPAIIQNGRLFGSLKVPKPEDTYDPDPFLACSPE